MQKQFDIRVNAPNSTMAKQLVDNFFKDHVYSGGISYIALFDHGTNGQPMLGGAVIGDEIYELFGMYPVRDGWASFHFLGCNVARGKAGKLYMQNKAKHFKIRVIANENKTSWDVLTPPPDGEANYRTNHSTWFEARPDTPAPVRILNVDTGTVSNP